MPQTGTSFWKSLPRFFYGLLIAFGLVPSAFSYPGASAPASDFIEYPVQQDDTLSALAKRFCVADYRVIARDSGLANPNLIYVGKTTLRIKNGCSTNAPSVLAKQSVSPRELAGDGEASSGKHISKPQAALSLPSVPPPVDTSTSNVGVQSPKTASVEETTATVSPLAIELHSKIYRIAAIKQVDYRNRTRAQNAELNRLQGEIRQAVLARYPLTNADCLYAGNVGKNWSEQTAFRVGCIRENYGAVMQEVSRDMGIPASYQEAIMVVESGGQPDAVSPTGCTGLKQFTQRSAKLFGLVDRLDPFESIRAAGRHHVSNLELWKGNVAKATAHYNAGSVLVGSKGFDASKFSYTQAVLRVQRFIEAGMPTEKPNRQAKPLVYRIS